MCVLPLLNNLKILKKGQNEIVGIVQPILHTCVCARIHSRAHTHTHIFNSKTENFYIQTFKNVSFILKCSFQKCVFPNDCFTKKALLQGKLGSSKNRLEKELEDIFLLEFKITTRGPQSHWLRWL